MVHKYSFMYSGSPGWGELAWFGHTPLYKTFCSGWDLITVSDSSKERLCLSRITTYFIGSFLSDSYDPDCIISFTRSLGPRWMNELSR